MQCIPVGRFISDQSRTFFNGPFCNQNAVAFMRGHERKRPPVPLAERHDNPALAGLMLKQAAINSVFF